MKQFAEIAKLIFRVILGSLTLLAYSPAGAQTGNAAMNDAINTAYERNAKEALLAYLPANEFYLSVEVQPSGEMPPQLPYVPGSMSMMSVSMMPLQELEKYVASVQVEVLVTKRFRSAREKIFKSLLTKVLRLNAERGDQIAFSDMPEPPQSIEKSGGNEAEIAAAQASLQVALSDLNQQKTKAETLTRERNDIQSELVLSKKEVETLRAQVDSLQSATTNSAGSEKTTDDKSALVKWGGPVAIGLAALFGLLTLAFAFMRAGGVLGGSVSAIAKALERISGAMQSQAQASLPETQGAVEVTAESSKALASGSDLEVVHKRILKLHRELIEGLNDETAQVVITQVSHLLQTSADHMKAVCTLEIFDREKANELFGQLGDAEQQKILRSLRASKMGSTEKAELMLSAGEELKSKFLAGAFRQATGKINPEVQKKLLRLSPEDLVEVATALHHETLPRLFVYLSPEDIAYVLGEMQKRDENKFFNSVAALPNVPSASKSETIDRELIPVINQQLEQISADVQRPYLAFYQDIIESSPDQLGESILNGLAIADARIEGFLKENVITFSTVFSLEVSIFEDIIGSLTNVEIAVVLSQVSPEYKEQISMAVGSRRIEMIADEEERIASMNQRQLGMVFSRTKKKVVDAIRLAKGDESLAEILAKNDLPPLMEDETAA